MLKDKILECLELSTYAYRNPERDWEIDLTDYDYVHYFECDNAYAFITKKNNNLYVIFRGSNDLQDWRQNLDFGLVKFNGFLYPGGWVEHYKLLRDDILNFVAEEEFENIYISGHSLGGSISQIASIDIVKHITDKRPINITFGSPKILGNKYTKTYYMRNVTGIHIQNSCDIVTRFPLFMINNQKKYKVGSCNLWTKIFGSINAHYPSEYKKNIIANKKLERI